MCKTQVTTVNALTKLLPGGFGWQTAAEITSMAGVPATGVGFSLAVGLGDAAGVGFGHLGYKVLSRQAAIFANRHFNKDWPVPNIKKESETSLMLATGSFLSGSAWQPTLDYITLMELGFAPTAVLTGLVCGAFFYAGLRVSRKLYPAIFGMDSIAATTENRKQDAALSMVGIAGATGMFVATDVSFEDNPLKQLLGADQEPLVNAARAGASTAAGFSLTQTTHNLFTSARQPRGLSVSSHSAKSNKKASHGCEDEAVIVSRISKYSRIK